jgi:hypothetical protein
MEDSMSGTGAVDEIEDEYIDEVLDTLHGVSQETDVEIVPSDEYETLEEEIADKFKQFKEERIPPEESGSHITENILRDAGLEPYEHIGGGQQTSVPSGSAEKVDIGSPGKQGDWVVVEGTVIEKWDVDTETIVYKFRVADDTGSIPVTVWDQNGESPFTEPIEVGNDYRFENLGVDPFEDAGRLELKTGIESQMSELPADEGPNIDPEEYQETVQGSIVNFKSPMGFVDTCSQCGRVISDTAECPDCGETSTEEILRLKCVVDSGSDSWLVILDGNELEEVAKTEIEAVESHRDQYGEMTDNVGEQMLRVKAHGQSVKLHGIDNGGRFDVESVELRDPPTLGELDNIEKELEEVI